MKLSFSGISTRLTMKVALLSVCDMLHVVVETRTSHDRQDHPVTEPGQGGSGGVSQV